MRADGNKLVHTFGQWLMKLLNRAGNLKLKQLMLIPPPPQNKYITFIYANCKMAIYKYYYIYYYIYKCYLYYIQYILLASYC